MSEGNVPSSSKEDPSIVLNEGRSWWRWRWRAAPSLIIGEGTDKKQNTVPSPSTVLQERRIDKPPEDMTDGSVWDRLVELYTKPSMERDVVVRVSRMTFLAGFAVGGANGYALARQQYETANKGRKYLSPSDAFKRRYDYAIVRFAMKGFSVGLKCAFISGSILLLSTHTAAISHHFSPFYFPAFSGPLALTLHTALVGGVFSFPMGAIGAAKAVGLGITSGLTLSAVCGLYALSVDRSVNNAYWHFKKEYESEMRDIRWSEKRIARVMEERKCWRYEAMRIVQEEDDKKLHLNDA